MQQRRVRHPVSTNHLTYPSLPPVTVINCEKGTHKAAGEALQAQFPKLQLRVMSTLPFITITIDPSREDTADILGFVLAQPGVKIVEADQIITLTDPI